MVVSHLVTTGLDERSSGVLIHLSSLPGRHGTGDAGPGARAFVDFLKMAGQRWWQLLPVGPPGYRESPYAAESAFAGNPFFVSLDELASRGLLCEDEIRPREPLRVDRVDFAKTAAHRMPRLALAHERWKGRGEDPGYARFLTSSSRWLDDFALFRALKRAHGGVQWTRWETGLKMRHPEALERARNEHARDVDLEKFIQYAFFTQWAALRAYATKHGVGLIGDIPLVIAHDSADVWRHPELFFLGEDGEPTAVAGVPPDYFSATGQRWGNPLYRWKRMKKDGYAWWADRLRLMMHRFDAIRIDHFIGFQRYWRIPAAEPTAVGGAWMKGPRAHFFSTMKKTLGDLPLIAEDLGAATRAVFALRDKFGFPGIKVLQFAFGTDANADSFLPHNYPRRAVVFTGTHDNDTVVGWFQDRGGAKSTRTTAEADREREYALRYLGSNGNEIHWDMIRAAYASVANLAIIPMQDLLGLGSEARMNQPATESGNWVWRVPEEALSPELADRLSTLTRTYGRGAES
jgi:4-alpha-glucanotransferase